MFGIGWTEILLVGIVALLVLKPQDYPDAMRSLGRMINKARAMAGEFQGQFNDAMREANLDDVRKTLDEVRDMRHLSPVQKVTETLSRFADETRDMKKEIENTTTLLGDAPSSQIGRDPTEEFTIPTEPAPAVDLSAFTAPANVADPAALESTGPAGVASVVGKPENDMPAAKAS